MPISNLSGFGDNNKLYLVEINFNLENRVNRICLYSTRKITTKNELRDFLFKQNNSDIEVFGDGYSYNNTKVIIPCFIRADTSTSFIYYYYYMNDETGYRMSTISNMTFINKEV